MEEKKDEIRSGIRSISGSWNFYKLFLWFSNSPKNRGFTLTEILVVVAIIGVLAGSLITLINPIRQMQKARDSRRISDIKQIQTALEIYRADQGSYPPSASVRCGSSLAVGSIVYINSVPCDPKGTSVSYNYQLNPTNSSRYSIRACLEDSSNTTYPLGGGCGSTVRYYEALSP